MLTLEDNKGEALIQYMEKCRVILGSNHSPRQVTFKFLNISHHDVAVACLPTPSETSGFIVLHRTQFKRLNHSGETHFITSEAVFRHVS